MLASLAARAGQRTHSCSSVSIYLLLQYIVCLHVLRSRDRAQVLLNWKAAVDGVSTQASVQCTTLCEQIHSRKHYNPSAIHSRIATASHMSYSSLDRRAPMTLLSRPLSASAREQMQPQHTEQAYSTRFFRRCFANRANNRLCKTHGLCAHYAKQMLIYELIVPVLYLLMT